MNELYIVTGALGHLGNTLVRKLIAENKRVRGLALPCDRSHALEGLDVEIVRGDVRRQSDLERLFGPQEQCERIVIHAADIVPASGRNASAVYEVNVGGMYNILEMCKKYDVKRLVYVSSTHAIPTVKQSRKNTEVDTFDPALVEGIYAKTKAEATQLALDEAQDGLNAVVVHPTDIIGPNDFELGPLTRLVMGCLNGRLWAGRRGVYNFVDVRDVAQGILAAAQHGKKGECYILCGHCLPVTGLMQSIRQVSRRDNISSQAGFAMLATTMAEPCFRKLSIPLPYTRHSSNSNFICDKAKDELGYTVRDINDTLADTAAWLTIHKRGRKRRRTQLAVDMGGTK